MLCEKSAGAQQIVLTLEFYVEYNLNADPLRVDLLITCDGII